jgi:uncharacterized membrane protein
MEKIKTLIQQAEQETGAQILYVYATRASHYPTVPLLYASLLSLLLPLVLYYVTAWSYLWVYAAQLLCFASVYLILLYEPLRLALTPRFHKKARLKQRVKDLLHTQLALNPNLKTLMVIFIAQVEQLALVESNLTLDLHQETELLTQALHTNSLEHGVQQVLSEALPKLKRLAPKTNQKGDLLNNVMSD